MSIRPFGVLTLPVSNASLPVSNASLPVSNLTLPVVDTSCVLSFPVRSCEKAALKERSKFDDPDGDPRIIPQSLYGICIYCIYISLYIGTLFCPVLLQSVGELLYVTEPWLSVEEFLIGGER